MFRLFSFYCFFIMMAWLLLVLSSGCLFPDKKPGPGFTIAVLMILTQFIVIAASVVPIIIRFFLVKIMRLNLCYTVIAMFNSGMGLAGICFLLTGNLASVPFMIVFLINLLLGILMLKDAASGWKTNSSAIQNITA